MKKIGLTDNEATKDFLNINNYTTGLKKFILNCDTPMTISIQGTWGTGKTSIMNIVRHELDEDSNVLCVWFNAWQFSQFDMENGLASALLSYLVNALNPEDNSNIVKLTNGLKLAGSIGSRVALSTFGRLVGVSDLDSDKIITEACKLDNRVTLKAIDGFKREFSSCVDNTLKKKNKERLVIFIDDLDRLDPRKAVELLEVLKLFLDCEACVFVLAIDYDVVVHGVTKKYGYDSNYSEYTYEIGKMFFDKIIQVPFKVPVAHYDITNYIKESLSKINIPEQSSDSIKIYEQLIRDSIGTNPRTMKRIFNAFLLVKLIMTNDDNLDSKSYQLLFAILCLQHCNEKIYNYIVENRDHLNEEILEKILSGEPSVWDEMSITENIDTEKCSEVFPLLRSIKKLLSNTGKIAKVNYNKFLQVLNLSIVTSTSRKNNANGSIIVVDSKKLNFQNLGTDIIDDIILKIQQVNFKIDVMMKNLNSGAGRIYAYINDKKFVEICPRSEGYRVEVAINGKDSIEEFQRIHIENKWEVKEKDNKIVRTIKNHELEIEDVMEVIRFANITWEREL